MIIVLRLAVFRIGRGARGYARASRANCRCRDTRVPVPVQGIRNTIRQGSPVILVLSLGDGSESLARAPAVHRQHVLQKERFARRLGVVRA